MEDMDTKKAKKLGIALVSILTAVAAGPRGGETAEGCVHVWVRRGGERVVDGPTTGVFGVCGRVRVSPCVRSVRECLRAPSGLHGSRCATWRSVAED